MNSPFFPASVMELLEHLAIASKLEPKGIQIVLDIAHGGHVKYSETGLKLPEVYTSRTNAMIMAEQYRLLSIEDIHYCLMDHPRYSLIKDIKSVNVRLDG